jgi:hypothetical protein
VQSRIFCRARFSLKRPFFGPKKKSKNPIPGYHLCRSNPYLHPSQPEPRAFCTTKTWAIKLERRIEAAMRRERERNQFLGLLCTRSSATHSLASLDRYDINGVSIFLCAAVEINYIESERRAENTLYLYIVVRASRNSRQTDSAGTHSA